MQTRSFTNWNGSASSHPSVVASPKDIDELIEVVKDRDTYPSPVRAAGSFHSLNACFATTGTQVLLRAFDDIRVDLESKTITVGAAVTMVRIRDALRPYGMQTEVQPEIGNATAGSVACCGTKDASIGTKGLAQVGSTVIGVKLVDPQGKVEEITEDTDPDRLRVIRSSYGLLGVVFEVTFRIQPVIMLRYDYAVFSLTPPPTKAQLLGGADGMLGLVLPYANRMIVERRWVAGDGRRHISRSSRMKRYARDKLWELVCTFPTLLPYNRAFSVLDRGFVVSLRALSLMGGFKARRADSTVDFKFDRRYYFDFTFWTIPVSRWADFIPAYLRFCADFKRETGFRASLISEAYAMNQDDRSMLSPTAAEDVFTMDVTDTRVNDPRWAEFHRRLNPLVAGFGGRPLLNQTKHLTRDVVYDTLGNDWERFLKIRETEDPDGRFLSDYSKDLI
jgi:FAD/FMN-containing dehydrogenase